MLNYIFNLQNNFKNMINKKNGSTKIYYVYLLINIIFIALLTIDKIILRMEQLIKYYTI